MTEPGKLCPHSLLTSRSLLSYTGVSCHHGATASHGHNDLVYEADITRVQDVAGRFRSLHVKLMHHVAHHILLLVIISAVHEVLTSRPPQSMGLLMLITVSRKIIAETDHLGASVGSSTMVYMFHRFDENTPY